MSVCTGESCEVSDNSEILCKMAQLKKKKRDNCQLNVSKTLEDYGRAFRFTNTGSLHSSCFISTALMETEIRNCRPCIVGVVYGEDGSSELPSVNPNSDNQNSKKRFYFSTKKNAAIHLSFLK